MRRPEAVQVPIQVTEQLKDRQAQRQAYIHQIAYCRNNGRRKVLESRLSEVESQINVLRSWRAAA